MANSKWRIVLAAIDYLWLSIDVLPVTFPADHVDHAKGWDDIRQHVVFDHFVEGRHCHETWRAYSYSVGLPPPVTHDIKAQFTVAIVF